MNAISVKQVNRRNQRGLISFEMLAMAPLMTLASFLSINLMLVSYGAWYNDMACRDAARAASQRGGATTEERVRNAQVAAKAAVRSYKSVFGTPTVLGVPSDLNEPEEEDGEEESEDDSTIDIDDDDTEIVETSGGGGTGLPAYNNDDFELIEAKTSTGESDPAKCPFVRISTSYQVQIPFPMIFKGTSLTDHINFRHSYVFPLTGS
jgi:hypothetical protein